MRLFLTIFNSNKDFTKRNEDIKLIPEMLNLLGCNKENFVKLLKQMDYKTYEKNKDLFFKYSPSKKNYKTNKKKT